MTSWLSRPDVTGSGALRPEKESQAIPLYWGVVACQARTVPGRRHCAQPDTASVFRPRTEGAATPRVASAVVDPFSRQTPPGRLRVRGVARLRRRRLTDLQRNLHLGRLGLRFPEPSNFSLVPPATVCDRAPESPLVIHRPSRFLSDPRPAKKSEPSLMRAGGHRRSCGSRQADRAGAPPRSARSGPCQSSQWRRCRRRYPMPARPHSKPPAPAPGSWRRERRRPRQPRFAPPRIARES